MDAGKGKGASAMQPAASALDGMGVKLMKGEVGTWEGQMNDGEFFKKRAEDVPVDQLFFYKFFKRKNEKAKVTKVDKQKEQVGESGNEDEDEEDADEAGGEQAEEDGEEDEEEEEEEEEEDSDRDEAEIWKAMKATMPKLTGDEDLMESDGPSSESDGDLPLEDENENDDEPLSLIEESDNEDLISLDRDPEGLIENDGPESGEEEEEEWDGIGAGDRKRKRTEGAETRSGRRKKMRSLPTFASYEDYARMIEDAPEDDI